MPHHINLQMRIYKNVATHNHFGKVQKGFKKKKSNKSDFLNRFKNKNKKTLDIKSKLDNWKITTKQKQQQKKQIQKNS